MPLMQVLQTLKPDPKPRPPHPSHILPFTVLHAAQRSLQVGQVWTGDAIRALRSSEC